MKLTRIRRYRTWWSSRRSNFRLELLLRLEKMLLCKILGLNPIRKKKFSRDRLLPKLKRLNSALLLALKNPRGFSVKRSSERRIVGLIIKLPKVNLKLR